MAVGDGAVDFHIERVEFALAVAQRIQQSAGAGGDAFSGGAGGFLGQKTGFDGATDDVLMGGFGREAFGAGSTHESVPLAQAGTARDRLASDFAVPITKWSTAKDRVSIVQAVG